MSRSRPTKVDGRATGTGLDVPLSSHAPPQEAARSQGNQAATSGGPSHDGPDFNLSIGSG